MTRTPTRRAPARKAPKGPGVASRVAGRIGAALAARPVPVFGTLAATVATGAVLANMLLMQPGPHPAPLFSTTSADAPAAPSVTGASEAPASLLVKDVQSALATRGFYSGPIDGYAGPSTAAAISDFERAEGLAVTGVASEKVLVRALLGPSASAAVTTTTTRVPAPAPSHAVAASVDVKRIQQALADLGYGPLTVDGKAGGQTASAIRRFRLDHGLPVNGDIDDRLVATLAGIGGLSTN